MVYDAEFFDTISPGSRASAKIVLPVVNNLLHPKSVLDVGCGLAAWLAEWRDGLGVMDICGVDGLHVDPSRLQVPSTFYRAADLEGPLHVGRQFDLVQSLEVAEHLDKEHAEEFVDSLTEHGPAVLFSAAIPRQGGNHHVNEQWPSYWARKFASRGFDAYDVIRPAIWGDKKVEWWYRQNIIVFSRLPLGVPPAAPDQLDRVHPALWERRTGAGRDAGPGLRELFRQFPPATRRAVVRRLPGASSFNSP